MLKGIIKEFKKSLNAIRNEKFDYSFLFLQFVYFSGLVRQFGTDEFLAVNIICSGFVCLHKKKLTSRELKYVLLVILGFLVITLFPTILHGIDPKLFLGYLGRLFLGLFIVIYFKDRFFVVFENLVFVLAFISIPLFFIQIIYVDFFSLLQPISDNFLGGSRLNPSGREGIYTTHQYGFIYLVNQWALFRNSGFMWEPAAYGAILSWAMVFNFYLNRFQMNSRLIVFTVACLTTFSIGAYIYLSILLAIFLIHKLSYKKLGYAAGLVLLIGFALSQLEFVSDNVNMIASKIATEQRVSAAIQNSSAPVQDLSRVGAVVANTEKIVTMPFGYGLHQSYNDFPDSPNGFITLLRNWGLFALVVLLYCSYKMNRRLSRNYYNNINSVQFILLMGMTLLPLAGNPFYNQPMLIAILLSGFIVKTSHK